MRKTSGNKQKYLLIPLNFDNKGAGVVTYGVSLARELNLKIKLLHVLTTPGVPAPVEAHAGSASFNSAPGELIKERREQAEQKLRALSNRVKNESGLDCEYGCRFGFVDIQIMKQSEKDQVALVLMGTPKHDTILNQLLGSRSLKIINHSDIPVLLVPNQTGYLPIRQIVIGVNYESWSKSRNQWLVKVATRLNAKLHFVRVIKKKTNKQELMFKGYQKQVIEALPNNLQLEFNLVLDESIDHGLRTYTQLNHADLIALQRSEKSTWEHFFSENVSKDMVLDGSVPVLVY